MSFLSSVCKSDGGFEVVLGDVKVVDILLLFLFDLYSRWVYVVV